MASAVDRCVGKVTQARMHVFRLVAATLLQSTLGASAVDRCVDKVTQARMHVFRWVAPTLLQSTLGWIAMTLLRNIWSRSLSMAVCAARTLFDVSKQNNATLARMHECIRIYQLYQSTAKQREAK